MDTYMDTCFFDGSSGQMASPLAGGASGIVRQQFGGIGAERGGESQQIPHIWLVAPGEPVGHGHLVLVATTKAAGAKEGGVRVQLL